MKFKLIIDADREEEIIVYAHSRSEKVQAIEALAQEGAGELVGYRDKEIIPLQPDQVCCFVIEGERVYALLPKERLLVKSRLYQLEQQLPSYYIKINQSCLANRHKILRFDASYGGSLRVHFEGGHIDYVSRRQLKVVKERFGIK